MPLTRVPARRAALLLAVLLTATAIVSARNAVAQEADPAGEAPAGSAPAKAKPRPKPAPKPVPAKPAQATVPAPTPAAATGPTATGPTAPWPVGATSVTESYGDWTVSCERPADRVNCIVVQSQGDSKTGRRKFGFELSAPKEGRAEGVILMPFGLAIDAGITFKLDEQTLGKGAPYSTCTSDGCLVPISFPTLATDGMRNAKMLIVTGQKSNDRAGGTEAATISVPLAGFSQAFDRALAFGG